MSQPTLFSFFSRTPKSTGSPSSNSKKGDTPNSNGKHANGNSAKRSPSSKGVNKPGASPSTPVSRSVNGGKKRRRADGDGESDPSPGSQSESASMIRKKLKNGDAESPSKEDFSNGSLVWAILEGYPWWPSMIRGETRRGPFYKSESMEYHVQFFDNPPTRAWIRKGDIKPYKGSAKADVPPAKSDKSWIAACKSADGALSMTNDDRIEKFWHEFTVTGNQEFKEAENAVDDVEVNCSETSNKKQSDRTSKRHKRIRAISSSSEDEDASVSIGKKGKSKKKVNDDDDDDYCPTNIDESIVEDEEEAEVSDSVGESDDCVDSANESEEEEQERKRSRPRATASSTPKTPRGAASTSNNGNRLQQRSLSNAQRTNNNSGPSENTGEKNSTVWAHMTWSWAKEGKRQDNRRRKETEDDYDPTTLLVPLDFLKALTPGMRQWWDIKVKHFDTILFFKVGKFYEFYHWDACIAAKELGITFMKGDFAHSGFPEISFSRFANVLVEKGYKIARVEQTETPEANLARTKSTKTKLEKHEKCIRRELCQISTKGVRYASFQDDAISSPFSPESVYLYAVVEKVNSGEKTVFGVCFIDTTIGTFHIGQFHDDRHASRLRTLFSHYVPVQILYERNKISPSLQQLLNNMSGVRKDPLTSETQFWNAKKALTYLREEGFFRDSESATINWPPTFQTVLCENDGLGLTPGENWELGVTALGGIISYLKYCLLDHDMLSQKRFEIYEPVDKNNDSQDIPQRCFRQKHMVLDGITIRNLDISDGPHSLFATIDKCSTNFGKRLLRHWLCLPLAIPESIAERLDAVEELMKLRECRSEVIPLLKTMPDLERLLSKIHYLGSAHRSKSHPDGRASFYEEVKYSKNKITDLLSTLKGFKTCVEIVKKFHASEEGIGSNLLAQLLESFPPLNELLAHFDNAFDHQLALKEGKIKPRKGAIEEYDEAIQTVEDIEKEANTYLKNVAKELRANRISYFGSDKKRFQIEVPDTIKVPKQFEMSSSKKGFKRYHSAETKEFLSSIMRAEANRDEILRDIARKIFEKFDNSRETWSKAVECICNIDVLISLSLFSESQETMCRPIIRHSEKAFINISEGRHPCIPSDNYISNDTKLGIENEESHGNGNFVILTGPNMGGKSTLMRQVGLLSVLSHLGCYVPAEKCEMSVVDRIFTRLGANDNIGEGESTFFVEMSETSSILKHATSDSLLLIDELGRGTATYDGTAIAYAVAEELSRRNCRSLFSTHYHTLVETLQDNSEIQLSHMACMVENENEEDPTQESITFLYKMISGPCPKSYGFNAARLAGISDEVVRLAHKKAKELEASVSVIRSFTDVCSRIRQNSLSLNEFAALKI